MINMLPILMLTPKLKEIEEQRKEEIKEKEQKQHKERCKKYKEKREQLKREYNCTDEYLDYLLERGNQSRWS